MYALVIDKEIVRVFANPEGFTLNDNQYSSQIFTLWSKEEKQAIGIYEIETDSSNFKDMRRKKGNEYQTKYRQKL